VETQLNLQLLRNLALQVNYSYLDPDEITAFNPKHQFKYMLMYRFGIFHYSLYGKYIDNLFAANEFKNPLPDYHVLDMMVSLRFIQWDIYFKLQNLLDRTYYVLPGYPAPKFHIFAGIKFAL
jgi:outer membrane receptor protein involved in Fe transport